MAFQTQLVQISGVRIHVADAGSGPPVLLLHGFPDSLQLWRHQIPALVESGYRVLAYDQRGFGNSDAPPGRENYRLDSAVGDSLGVLDTLGITEKVRVVGHDWGAVVGWLLAMRFPERVERLVAVSVGHPAAYRTAGLAQKLRAWYALLFQVPGLSESMLRAGNWAGVRAFAPGHPETARWIHDLSRPGRLTAGLNWYRANLGSLLRGEFPAVRVPVLGVWSTRDPALTERQMTNSAHYAKSGWRYVRLEGIGHWIPLDAPDELNRLLLEEFAYRPPPGW